MAKELISAVTMIPGYFITWRWYSKINIWVPIFYKSACTFSIVYHALLHFAGFNPIALKLDIFNQMMCCVFICLDHDKWLERYAIIGFIVILMGLDLRQIRQRRLAYGMSAAAILMTSGRSPATPLWLAAFVCFLVNKVWPTTWLHGAFHMISHVATVILIDKRCL